MHKNAKCANKKAFSVLLNACKKLERVKGFEPSTHGLGKRRGTILRIEGIKEKTALMPMNKGRKAVLLVIYAPLWVSVSHRSRTPD